MTPSQMRKALNFWLWTCFTFTALPRVWKQCSVSVQRKSAWVCFWVSQKTLGLGLEDEVAGLDVGVLVLRGGVDVGV